MVEKWKAQEIVQYLEEQLSNSLFHDDLFEAMENGYRCAINDIKEKYIDEDVIMVCLDCGNRDVRYDEKEKSYHCNNCGSRELGNNFTYCIGDYVFDKSENKVRLAIERDNHRSDVEYIGRFLNLDEAMICYKNMNI